jgi:hypothetical protein
LQEVELFAPIHLPFHSFSLVIWVLLQNLSRPPKGWLGLIADRHPSKLVPGWSEVVSQEKP